MGFVPGDCLLVMDETILLLFLYMYFANFPR